MPDAVFIETTIPSYYVARPSRNVLELARQSLTRRWWDEERGKFDLYTSQTVLTEAAGGEAGMARARLSLLVGIPLLGINDEIVALAAELIHAAILPPNASQDALHIATAAVYRIRFLLTWNCKHIANPFLRRRIASCFSRRGIDLPLICTPEEFIRYDQSDSTA